MLVGGAAVALALVWAAHKFHWGLLVGADVVQVGTGETSYFLKRCRYLTFRGLFEQRIGEESRWRLERYSCSIFL
jgi:hypothetical protein